MSTDDDVISSVSAASVIATQQQQRRRRRYSHVMTEDDVTSGMCNNNEIKSSPSSQLHQRSSPSQDDCNIHHDCYDKISVMSQADERPYSHDEVSICQETALISLVDGVIHATNKRMYLYKCVICQLLYSNIDSLLLHLRMHVTAAASSVMEDVQFKSRDEDVRLRHIQANKRSTSVPHLPEPETDTKTAGRTTSTRSLDTPSNCHLSNSSSLVAGDMAEDLSKRRLRSFNSRRRSIQSLQCRRPTQRLALVTSEMLANQHEENCSNDDVTSDVTGVGAGGDTLANAIRQKEHLGDDVTVVIPSDAPLDVGTRQSATNQSANGTPSWTGGETAACGDNIKDETDKQITHSPVKSIMGHPLVQRKSRLGSNAGTSSTDGTEKLSSLLPGVDGGVALSASQLSLINAAAESLQFAGSLPAMFGPLALSTFVNGFGGFVAATSPFLPYYTQMPTSASLASLMATTSSSVATSQSTTVTTDASDMKPVVDSSSDSCQGNAANIEMEEASNSSSNGAKWQSESGGFTGFSNSSIKCSSLSRTHSRLNVVRRPIKREDACRPVVLSDGRTAFRCIYCKKDFCTISDVNRHMDFHEDIRPYKCRFCNYYARTNSQLKVHMMRHQGIREYMCRLCNYKGVTQSDLNRHTKSQIHLMKARNECLQCSEGFVSPMNLEQHRQDKHLSPHSSTNHNGHRTTL